MLDSEASQPEEKTEQKAKKQPRASGAPPYDEKEMLSIVRAEMQRSIGFENDATLSADRRRALDYFKGDMRSDIPALPNRSRAVDTTVADAVATILPDLMEIFTGGSDTVAFTPNKPGDENAARQETQYLTHVIFQENPGFLNLHTAFSDGLLLKTALFEFGWKTDYFDEAFSRKMLQELIAASQSGNVHSVKAEPADQDYPNAQQTYAFKVRQDCSGAEYWAVPPDDFGVAPDTVRLADATYCVARYRPRVQDLIAEGYDEDAVKELSSYAGAGDAATQRARDQAGEHEEVAAEDDSSAMLRQVEIRKHYLRLKDPDGDSYQIWRIVTDAAADTIIPYEGESAQEWPLIPFAGGSPYLISHRFYGMSLADNLAETQRIKSVLTRALLDSSYFALNQRFEIAMEQANDYTISDLLRNEPAVPVRSKSGNAVRPLSAGGLGFDAYAALEYFSTVGESKSGVVRNAQGLNPDTLHDTAKGAMMLMQNAQRRVRMVARVLAETVVKELYLGVHALIREHAEAPRVTQLNGEWVTIDPTTWGERNSMTIEVGLGASGREMELATLNSISADQQAAVAAGGLGKVLTLDNIYNLQTDKAKALGRRQPDRYWTNPEKLQQSQPPPQPPPEVITAQIKDATARRGQDLQAQAKAEQTQAEAALKAHEIETKAQTDIITTEISGRQHSAMTHVGIGGNQV